VTAVHIADRQTTPVEIEAIRSLAEQVIRMEGYPHQAELSIHLVLDDEMAGRNQQALGRSGPTDVLSFPIEDLAPGLAPAGFDEGPPLLLGDVVIAPSVVARQAVEFGVSFGDEMALMVVHGILHLLGYDHAEPAEEREMFGLQDRLLAQWRAEEKAQQT